MWVWLDRLAPLLFDASLAAAVLTSVFLAFLLVSLQPARRIALARTAILAVLAIAPLAAFAPWPRFHIVHTLKRSPLAPRQIFVRRVSAKISARELQKSDRDAIATVPIGDESETDTHWIRAAELARRPLRLLVLGYLVIVSVGLAWGALGYLGVWWLIRSSSPPSEQTLRIFESLPREPGDDRDALGRPSLRISDRVQRPVVVALLHPTILLPPQFDGLPHSEEDPSNPESEALLRLSLLHELVHARRHDASFQLVGSVAQAIWFFLPQLWWIRAQLRLDQEFLADHVASSAYGTSSQYAASLLDLAAARTDRHVPGPVPSTVNRASTTRELSPRDPSAVPSSLGQRLLMLLHCPYRLEPMVPPGWLWGLRVVGVAATFALANVSVRLPGVAYGSSPTPHPSIEGVFLAGMNRFQVSELIIAPTGGTDSGRSDSYVVPYHLPEHYSMTLDVLASQEKLSHIRLMNLPLANLNSWPSHPSPLDHHRLASHFAPPTEDGREHWHHVRIERNNRGISLSVDEHELQCPSVSTDALIRVDPPVEKPVELRNLIVTPTS